MKITHLSPKEITETVGISMTIVLGWISSGKLKAANISSNPGRPRWRVRISDLDDFLDSLSAQPEAKKSTGKPRKKSGRTLEQNLEAAADAVVALIRRVG